MSEPVELEQLTDSAGTSDQPGMADLRRLSDVPIDLTVEIGRTRLTVGETLELRQGSILTLNRMAGEPVDLLVNGTPIARGEVVVIDEQFGVRITDVLGHTTAPAGRAQRLQLRAPAPAAASRTAARRRGVAPTSRVLTLALTCARSARSAKALPPDAEEPSTGPRSPRRRPTKTTSGGSTCRTRVTRGSWSSSH